MAVDSQTVTLGTSGNSIGYSGVGTTYGSISDGTCNFKSGAAYEGLLWDSSQKYLRLQVHSTSQLSNAGFGGLIFPDGDFYPRTAAAISYISYITATQWLWSGVASSPWGGSTSGNKIVTFENDSASNSHGFQVFNSAGLIILDSFYDKTPSVIVEGTTTVPGSGTSSAISCLGMTTTNSNEISVLFYDEPAGTLGTAVQVTRGNGSFTLTNPLNTPAVVKWAALRY